MTTKLTLDVEESLLRFGEEWARNRGKSLSSLFADYLSTLEKFAVEEQDLPPITRRLLGIASGVDVDEEDYRRYLEGKHR